LHIGNEIIFSLSGGFLISLFFWFLVVKLPEIRKREIIKNNISAQYQHFKEDTIQILLLASIGTHDSQLHENFVTTKNLRNSLVKIIIKNGMTLLMACKPTKTY